MKFTKFYLEGLGRLRLSRIKRIELDLTKPITFILGKNGSGKSSLMNEINLLPIQATMYKDGGGKGGECILNGHTFTFVSKRIGKVAKHSLWKNGEVICEDATSTIYMQRLMSETNYNKTLHKLQTQTTKFTDMSFSERQKTLTDISNLDLTYALSFHEKLQKSLRDTKGALLHLRRRLGDLQTDRAQLGEEDEIRKKIELLTTRQRELFRTIGNRSVSKSNGELEADYVSTMGRHAERILSVEGDNVHKVFSENPYASREELEKSERDLLDSKMVLVERAKGVLAKIDEETKYRRQVQAGEEGRESLRLKIENVKSQLKGIPSNRIAESDFNAEPFINQHSLSEGTVQRDNLIYHAQQRPNPYRPVSDSEMAEIEAQRELAFKRVRGTIEEINRLEADLFHYDESLKGALTCGSCGTKVFSTEPPSEEQVTLWRSMLDIRKGWLEKTKDREEEYLESIRLSSQCNQWGKQLEGILDSHPFGRIAISISEVETFRIEGYVVTLDAMLSDIKDAIEERTLALELVDLEAHYTHWTTGVKSTVSVDSLQDTLTHINKQIASIDSRLTLIGKIKRALEQAKLEEESVFIWNEENNPLNVFVEGVTLNLLQEEAAGVAAALSEVGEYMGTLRDLETNMDLTKRDIARLSEEEELLQEMAGILSPKTGIIAEQMEGFLGEFVGHINKIISLIWSYPIDVCVPKLDNGKMEYRFPVNIMGETSGDISETSEGQAGLINLAFSLIMISYSSLDNYPLYLDEIGREFDEAHRITFMRYIRSLVSAGSLEQILMISHSAVEYGDSNNINYVVLSKDNISLPKYANANTKITFL